jgi:hypothetical protein
LLLWWCEGQKFVKNRLCLSGKELCPRGGRRGQIHPNSICLFWSRLLAVITCTLYFFCCHLTFNHLLDLHQYVGKRFKKEMKALAKIFNAHLSYFMLPLIVMNFSAPKA